MGYDAFVALPSRVLYSRPPKAEMCRSFFVELLDMYLVPRGVRHCDNKQ